MGCASMRVYHRRNIWATRLAGAFLKRCLHMQLHPFAAHKLPPNALSKAKPVLPPPVSFQMLTHTTASLRWSLCLRVAVCASSAVPPSGNGPGRSHPSEGIRRQQLPAPVAMLAHHNSPRPVRPPARPPAHPHGRLRPNANVLRTTPRTHAQRGARRHDWPLRASASGRGLQAIAQEAREQARRVLGVGTLVLVHTASRWQTRHATGGRHPPSRRRGRNCGAAITAAARARADAPSEIAVVTRRIGTRAANRRPTTGSRAMRFQTSTRGSMLCSRSFRCLHHLLALALMSHCS